MGRMLAIIEGLATFAALSAEGRRFTWNLYKNRPKEKRAAGGLLRDRWQRRLLLANGRACDRAFQKWIPREAAERLARSKQDMYSRMLPLAWCNVALRTRLFHAFDIDYDDDAMGRCAVFSFGHREWNDLFDGGGYSVVELLDAFRRPHDARPEVWLLAALRDVSRRLAPHDEFPNFHAMIEAADPVAITKENAPKTTESAAAQGRYHALVSTYVMVNDIPEAMKEAMGPVGMWFYSLDDIADQARDASAVSRPRPDLEADPEARIWELYDDCRKCLESNAARPEAALLFMRAVTESTVRTTAAGVDVEKALFGG